MQTRTAFLWTVLLGTLAGCAWITGNTVPSNLASSVTADSRRSLAFEGVGAQWDTYSYASHPLSTEDFDVIKARIAAMKPSIFRVMMLTKWCYNAGTYDFLSPEMQQLYRVLDVAKADNITVFLTDWGCGTPGNPDRAWMTTPGIVDAADPVYATVIGTYLDYLVNTKGYTNIRYFGVGNEPNLEMPDFATWKTAVTQVATTLTTRGLNSQILLTGSDESGGDAWHRQAITELHDQFQAYDFHGYPDDVVVRGGDLEALVAAKRQAISDLDPNGDSKPLIIGEAGVKPLENNNGFEYGLQMADYAVQSMNAGISAISAWMLDDNSYTGFTNGAWKNQDSGLELRPWCYSWSLITRGFPSGSHLYQVSEPDKLVRVAVADLVDGGYSVCVVNRGWEATTLTITLPSAPKGTWSRFVYQDVGRLTTTEGFPLATETSEVSSATLNVPVPPLSTVLMTTRP